MDLQSAGGMTLEIVIRQKLRGSRRQVNDRMASIDHARASGYKTARRALAIKTGRICGPLCH